MSAFACSGASPVRCCTSDFAGVASFRTGANSVKIVKCDDASATFKVVGRVDDKTEVDASIDACDSYASQGAVSVYWQGTSGGKGMVLCLAKNR